ncbi:hypothetical protein [Opitutus terrae]|uniref:Uncharacterized protein n=1 Tax=Opitutus terrae (strain DSM 11246 / JCM 15787 / PB90-1) TaxID=452637 RepID=B1ZWJ6_OPITP|nr:hypothetical protein [Opitutus terrae]ACB73320.1 hypothetical protein Oter_0028 [Opitutus terrae PB90-1]
MEPLTVTRRAGRIVLEIDENRFLADALSNPENHLSLADRQAFFDFVAKHLFTLTHDVDENGAHPSWWLRLSQALANAAASARQGINRAEAVAPTCGCDPEEHDGG